jgi:hypothetical protein
MPVLSCDGRTTDFFERPRCRLKAAFRLAAERRLQAAAGDSALRRGRVSRLGERGYFRFFIFFRAFPLAGPVLAAMPFGNCLAPVGGRCPEGTFENSPAFQRWVSQS